MKQDFRHLSCFEPVRGAPRCRILPRCVSDAGPGGSVSCVSGLSCVPRNRRAWVRPGYTRREHAPRSSVGAALRSTRHSVLAVRLPLLAAAPMFEFRVARRSRRKLGARHGILGSAGCSRRSNRVRSSRACHEVAVPRRGWSFACTRRARVRLRCASRVAYSSRAPAPTRSSRQWGAARRRYCQAQPRSRPARGCSMRARAHHSRATLRRERIRSRPRLRWQTRPSSRSPRPTGGSQLRRPRAPDADSRSRSLASSIAVGAVGRRSSLTT